MGFETLGLKFCESKLQELTVAPHRLRSFGSAPEEKEIRPVHLLRVFLLRVLESNFPGDSL